MLSRLSLFCLLLSLLCMGCQDAPLYVEELKQLDDALANNQEWIARKERVIDELRDKLARTVSDEERYWINKDLYSEYLEFDADSAHYYVEQNVALAQLLDKPEEVQRWTIERAVVLIQTGQLREAELLLDAVSKEDMSEQVHSYYYAQMMRLHHAYSVYLENIGTAERSRHFAQALQYRDSVLRYAPANENEYLNIKAWNSFDGDNYASIKEQLINKMESSALNTPEDAVSAYTLAHMCREDGQQEEFLFYLIQSAISYVRSGSRNYASESIQELSKAMLELGDLNRAYTYINYCANNIYSFKNRTQIVRMVQWQEEIQKQYFLRERSHEVFMKVSLGIITFLFVVLLLLTFYIYKQMSRLRMQDKKLQTVNTDLQNAYQVQKALNEQLRQSNELLKRANVLKENYIGYAFSICSNYMNKLDEFRKAAGRKLKTGQLNDLNHFLMSDNIMRTELKGFHQTFDEVFLFLYPNFITDLNKLLVSEMQFKLKDEKHLNTDLRIVALMSLGFTDANKIAEFLHCTVQSIYNCRRSLYSRLTISVKEFKDRVTTLGRV